jgi:hypothetical protein
VKATAALKQNEFNLTKERLNMRRNQMMLIVACFVGLMVLSGYGQVTSKVDIVHLQNADGTSTSLFGRERLIANRTYYVRPDGNDNNTGLANDAAHALLTLQAAANAYQALDCNGYDVTIQVADGTYNGGVSIRSRMGSGNLYLTGNTATPTNVAITSTNSAIEATGHPAGSYIYISGFKLSTTGAGYGIASIGGSQIQIVGKMEFGSIAWAQLHASLNGVIHITTSEYSISGGAQSHYSADMHAVIFLWNPCTVTLTGTPAFSNVFARASAGGVQWGMFNLTFSGSATGRRYGIDANAVINSGGSATLFPGNVAGVIYTGGQYF